MCLQRIVVASARHCGCRRKALWLKSNRDFSSASVYNPKAMGLYTFFLYELLLRSLRSLRSISEQIPKITMSGGAETITRSGPTTVCMRLLLIYCKYEN